MYGYESPSSCLHLDSLRSVCELKILVFWVGGVCRIEFVILRMTDLNQSRNFAVADETVPSILRIKRGRKTGYQVFWTAEGVTFKGFTRRRQKSSKIYTIYCHRYGKSSCNFTFKCQTTVDENTPEFFDPNFWSVLPRKPRKNCVLRHGFVTVDLEELKQNLKDRSSPYSPCNVMQACSYIILFNQYLKEAVFENQMDPHTSAFTKIQLLDDIPEEALSVIGQGFKFCFEFKYKMVIVT